MCIYINIIDMHMGDVYNMYTYRYGTFILFSNVSQHKENKPILKPCLRGSCSFLQELTLLVVPSAKYKYLQAHHFM